jgi:hypothetical protein
MRSKGIVFIGCVSLTAVLMSAMPARMSAEESRNENSGGRDELIYEFVGQVQNFPPAGPGQPPTSIQYGYLSHIEGLGDSQIYLPGVPQNEASALFTFYNDSVTQKVTTHGSLRIVIREGTTTIYLNGTPSGDFTTPNPDSFRQGTPVLATRWRHQVILDGAPAPDPNAPPRTNLFFVTWWHTITAAKRFKLGDDSVKLGRVGQTFRQHLVGGVDFTGTVNGKFAGYVVGPDQAAVHHPQ